MPLDPRPQALPLDAFLTHAQHCLDQEAINRRLARRFAPLLAPGEQVVFGVLPARPWPVAAARLALPAVLVAAGVVVLAELHPTQPAGLLVLTLLAIVCTVAMRAARTLATTTEPRLLTNQRLLVFVDPLAADPPRSVPAADLVGAIEVIEFDRRNRPLPFSRFQVQTAGGERIDMLELKARDHDRDLAYLSGSTGA